MSKTNRHLALAIAGIFSSTSVMAADVSGDPIVAVPGREVCQARPVAIADKDVDAKLCVSSESFGHDKYAVKIGWSRVVEGIDDETTKGIMGTYKGHAVALICTPQIKAPGKDDDAAVNAMAKSLEGHSGVTAEKAHDVAVTMMSTEVGRVCSFREGDRELMSVLVRFD